jgi:lipoyl-dependent peroxiredoxin
VATDRVAEAVWEGDLRSGSGTIERVGSGAFGPLDVTWASRSEEPNGKTSPEELIAAAWSACYSMALANVLAKGGHPPQRLETSATVTFQPGEGIVKGALKVAATVTNLTNDEFSVAAEDAKANCPVSKALAGIPEVTLTAQLAG